MREALRLLDGDGVAFDAALRAMFARLPQVDWLAVHSLADRLTGRDNEHAYETFMSGLYRFLDRMVRAKAGEGASAASLAPYARAWERITEAARDTEVFNFDKRGLILSIFADLEEAAKSIEASLDDIPISKGFPPVSRADARVLILGSLPGQVSLARVQYYAQPRNAFWPIMGRLFGAAPELPYEERLERLMARGVALWDVCAEGRRPGSLDQKIDRASVAPNDFAGFLAAHAADRADRLQRRHGRRLCSAARSRRRCGAHRRRQSSSCRRRARRMRRCPSSASSRYWREALAGISLAFCLRESCCAARLPLPRRGKAR